MGFIAYTEAQANIHHSVQQHSANLLLLPVMNTAESTHAANGSGGQTGLFFQQFSADNARPRAFRAYAPRRITRLFSRSSTDQ